MNRTGFENLRVYVLSEEIADLAWEVVTKWDRLQQDTIGRQLVNSADSMGANIAEGTGRGSFAENRRFARIARGSLFEVKHWLRRAYKRRLLTDDEIVLFQKLIDELAPLNSVPTSIRLAKNQKTTNNDIFIVDWIKKRLTTNNRPLTMNSIPKVLFINPWDRLIGPNRYLAEMLRSTPELATRSTVVFHEANDALEEYRSMGCQVAVWPEVKLIHPHFTVSNLARLIPTHSLGLARVVQGLRSVRPDVVVTNTEIVTVGGMAARILRIPHVQVVHSLLFTYRSERSASVIKMYARWLSFFANRFIAVSETVKEMLSEFRLGDKKIMVVPNGFNVQQVREKSELPIPANVKDLIHGRYPVLVSVGRVAPMKGQDILVEAVNRIRDSYPSLVCLIVGRNGVKESVEDVVNFRQNLARQIEAHQLQTCVHFLGEVDYVPALLRHADLYLHPSWTESFSRVVAEALICGRPVVCTRAGALPEVVGPHGALFVQPGDAEALAQGVLRVLREESFRQGMALSGQAYVESHYQILSTTEKLLDVIRSAAHNGTLGHGR